MASDVDLKVAKDAFERLGLVRSAALEEEQLQSAYAKASREAHPDHGGSEAVAAAVNEAYETLRSPELRLRHLLEVAGPEEARSWRTVPLDEGMMTIFGKLGAVLQKSNATLAKMGGASSALAKALLAKQILLVREELEEIGFAVADSTRTLEQKFAELDERIAAEDEGVWKDLAVLQAKFAYLGRWQKQIREALLQLTVD